MTAKTKLGENVVCRGINSFRWNWSVEQLVGEKTPRQGLAQMASFLTQMPMPDTLGHATTQFPPAKPPSHTQLCTYNHGAPVLSKWKMMVLFAVCEKSEMGREVSGKMEHPKFSLGYEVRKGARNGTGRGCSRASWLPWRYTFMRHLLLTRH